MAYENLKAAIGKGSSLRLAEHRAAAGRMQNLDASIQNVIAEAGLAAGGSTTASPSSAAAAAGAAKPKSAAGPTYTKAELDNAVASALIRERARIAGAFASASTQGRERACARLLSSGKGFSAAAIAGFLADEPLDRDRSAKDPNARATADAVWDRANAKAGTSSVDPAPGQPANLADAVWDRAYAKYGAKAAPGKPAASSDVWERAYAGPRVVTGRGGR